MPQVRFESAKGLYQESGTKVVLNDAITKRPLFAGLTYVAQGDADFTATADTLVAWSFDGATSETVTLPAAEVGVRVIIHFAELMDGTDAAIIQCGSGDAFRTGSVIESRDTNAVVYDTSAAGETKVTLTPTATNSYWDLGSMAILSCLTKGLWDIEFRPKPDPAGTGLTGTAAFGA